MAIANKKDLNDKEGICVHRFINKTMTLIEFLKLNTWQILGFLLVNVRKAFYAYFLILKKKFFAADVLDQIELVKNGKKIFINSQFKVLYYLEQI